MPLKFAIEQASRVVGSQRALAALVNETEQHLSNMKTGTRPCSIEKRVQIAELAGLDTTRAVIEGLITKLDLDDPTQAGAANMLQAMLDAFPEEQPTIQAAPRQKGASARGVAAEQKPRLRKSLRTSMRRLRSCLYVGTKHRGKNRAIGPFFTPSVCSVDLLHRQSPPRSDLSPRGLTKVIFRVNQL